MNRIQKTQKTIMSIAMASLLAVMPIAASAQTLQATGSAAVVINQDGIVHVIGADVTSVSNDVVNAITTFGTIVMNWVVNVSASTKADGNGSKTATTTDIKAGDKINFAGSLSSSIGASLTVAATKIHDLVNFPLRHVGSGTISSINNANGSFVITNENHSVTVQTNASTTISLDGATSTLASLVLGEKVSVAGISNADGSIITARKVIVRTESVNNKKDTDSDSVSKKDTNSDDVSENTNAQVTVHSEDNHGGFNLFGGLHLGIGHGK